MLRISRRDLLICFFLCLHTAVYLLLWWAPGLLHVQHAFCLQPLLSAVRYRIYSSWDNKGAGILGCDPLEHMQMMLGNGPVAARYVLIMKISLVTSLWAQVWLCLMELCLKQTNHKIVDKQMPSSTGHMIHLKGKMMLFEGRRDFSRKRTKESERREVILLLPKLDLCWHPRAFWGYLWCFFSLLLFTLGLF